jgi:micrococcal nuclease
MLKLFRKGVGFIFILIIAVIVYFVFVQPRLKNIPGDEQETPEDTSEETSDNVSEAGYLVARVVDGDTFVLSDKSRVRLLGIDAPEMSASDKMDRDSERTAQDKETIKALGKASARHLKELIEGKRVLLTKENNYEDKDRYGRLLRYAYLEDGTFINGKMVQDGYAQVFRTYDVSRKNELLELEKDARENERGLWGTADGTRQFK